ncbi:MAG: hypothetical protein U0531_08210 [Dehalococcoidia bacterium]
MATDEPLLILDHVSCRFGGVRAVDDASFTVAPGTVHGLIGPNGAARPQLLEHHPPA